MRFNTLVFTLLLTLRACKPAVYEQTKPTFTPESTPAMIVEPLPNYLGVVRPDPGKSYSLAEYENLAPSLLWNATVPGICFSIEPFPLLVPGDFPTVEEWFKQMRLIVDDKVYSNHHSLLTVDLLGQKKVDPTTGEILYQEPEGSPLRVCYAVPLGVGQHTVTLVVEKTTGEEVPYTWSFEIIK